MNTTPLDELYLAWLYGQVGSIEVSNPSKTYWKLLRVMHCTEFFWFVPNDDNRAEDGKLLRQYFIQEEEIDRVDQDWLDLGCSMLELLVAMSRALAFQTDGEPRNWFWKMIRNLKLDPYKDSEFTGPKIEEELEEEIRYVLDTAIQRTYKSDGSGGGIFPLQRADVDQREVELWYQMSAYILENE